ncbi:glycogen/starch synthase, partial [Micromonospora marina]|uniref:glycogen/starch synthase n=1 Tax=Micromonospora marina TaxID=307120 RepID=UPI003F50622D
MPVPGVVGGRTAARAADAPVTRYRPATGASPPVIDPSAGWVATPPDTAATPPRVGTPQLKGGRVSADAEVIDIQPARRLRVLLLSWEYPPVLVGGLGRHVHALSVALAAAGHEVTVV